MTTTAAVEWECSIYLPLFAELARRSTWYQSPHSTWTTRNFVPHSMSIWSLRVVGSSPQVQNWVALLRMWPQSNGVRWSMTQTIRPHPRRRRRRTLHYSLLWHHRCYSYIPYHSFYYASLVAEHLLSPPFPSPTWWNAKAQCHVGWVQRWHIPMPFVTLRRQLRWHQICAPFYGFWQDFESQLPLAVRSQLPRHTMVRTECVYIYYFVMWWIIMSIIKAIHHNHYLMKTLYNF